MEARASAQIMWTADEIAHLCYTHYSTRLPKQGKPEPDREWTLLAAVVKVNSTAGGSGDPRDKSSQVTKEVVSMGTGTKCIGLSKMRKSGDILNDSHAEVIAKRSFQRYLFHQLRTAASLPQNSIFMPGTKTGMWKLKPDLHFVFFSSHTPCGDASIIPMLEGEDQPCSPVCSDGATSQSAEAISDPVVLENKRKGEEIPAHLITKRMKTENRDLSTDILSEIAIHYSTGKEESLQIPADASNSSSPANGSAAGPAATKGTVPVGAKVVDIYRTGAKCVPGEAGDTQKPGVEYHQVGLLRIKPGRGDRTSSMSCSDKLARWNVLGCQGALLMHFLEEPVYLTALVIGKCPYSPEAMKRALIDRCQHVSSLPRGFQVQELKMLQSDLLFEHSHHAVQAKRANCPGKIVPCGAAISWSAVPEQPLDVTCNGFRQGATKKSVGSPQARSKVCKVELFNMFQSLVSSISENKQPESLRVKKLETYWEYKVAATSYQEAWKTLQKQAFGSWIRNSPDYQQFK
ncbi:tRNA-specific adenosine deaminase 1 isoform X1 [Sarcophilus harrisii]|uniref:tRNA-specific adenosine deaminase 1 n=1 Tax=Sarcophilus harrisii TaxID=9305 RepID=G3VHL2_SARHA|nr:tRNA-specific adenosine deaminase 1 isoform X1 [Sarcophilus harrisii]XP_031805865.1 tRNA-specific adenosine deaminase 1 isoform X1 [Sarcophilus harrisii]XP_031805866.1 tRNA-specific adenosine deaminase 1 isoform X1 [Sarcophilus harrisii]XP_031805867.1 tRNA-specific adenosine deaminase 1 isoform X1 [Sarcophilus harrisii]